MDKIKKMVSMFNNFYGAEIRQEAKRTGQDFSQLLLQGFYNFINLDADLKEKFQDELFNYIKTIA